MVISPHSDDSEFGMGGSIIKFLEEGNRVHITLIEATTADFLHMGSKFIKGNIRIKEFENAIIEYRKFGNVSYNIWLTDENNKYGFFAEGHMDQVPIYDIIGYLDKQMDEFLPDILFIPGKSMHQDHRVVCDAALTACRPTKFKCPKEIYLYELSTSFWGFKETDFNPNVYIKIDPEKKVKVLAVHKSQMRSENNHLHQSNIIEWSKRRGFEANESNCEAFELVWKKIL